MSSHHLYWGRKIFKTVRRFSEACRKPFVIIGSKHRLSAALYYMICSRSFWREQRAFLEGRRRYYASLKSPEGSLAVLRRNVHRLEKGLLMRPRRVPFALKYIGETVSAFQAAVGMDELQIDVEEYTWAKDVLTEYFGLHSDVNEVSRYKSAFERAVLSPEQPEASEAVANRRVPYLRDLQGPAPVEFSGLWKLALRRRSVRWFVNKSVDRSLIDNAILLGTQAPSACNRQPFEFRVFDDRRIVQAIIEIPFGLVGYGHNVPVLAVVVGQQRHFVNERDRHLVYVDASLAVMGVLYGLEAQGLSSCCVNWPDIEQKEARLSELIGLAYDERPIMLIAIGYPDPDGMVANSTKKSISQIRRYNFE